MNKMFGVIFSIILTVFLILMFINMSDDYDKVIVIEEFTAFQNVSVEEEFIVDYRVNEILTIHINSYHMDVDDIVISINALGNGSIILEADVTGTGDIVIIEYNYVTNGTLYTKSLIDVIPVIMLLMLIGGIAFILIKGRK